MIEVNKIPGLLHENNCDHWKLLDSYGNTLFVCHGLDVSGAIEKYKEIARVFSGLDRFTVVAGSEGVYKANWRGALKWRVSQSGGDQRQPQPAGMVEKIGELQTQLAVLRLQTEYDKKIEELQRTSDNKALVPEKYMPLLLVISSKLFGIDLTELAGQPQPLGNTSVVGDQDINQECARCLCDLLKVADPVKVRDLLKAVCADPGLINKALLFLKK